MFKAFSIRRQKSFHLHREVLQFNRKVNSSR